MHSKNQNKLYLSMRDLTGPVQADAALKPEYLTHPPKIQNGSSCCLLQHGRWKHGDLSTAARASAALDRLHSGSCLLA